METTRLRLRPWQTDDADFVFDLYRRWEVQRFLGSAPRVMESLDEARDRIEVWRSRQHPVYGIWAVTLLDTGAPIGTSLLKELPASGPATPLVDSGDVEIGWHQHPDFDGHGYATEAARVVLDRAFAGGQARIHAVTYPENVASQAVCRRLGMSYEGSTDRYYNITCELFSIDRPAPVASVF